MIETKDGPLYPIWRVTASFKDKLESKQHWTCACGRTWPWTVIGCFNCLRPRVGVVIIAESEMIGNLINQIAKGLEHGYDTILIERTDKYVDARVPRT